MVKIIWFNQKKNQGIVTSTNYTIVYNKIQIRFQRPQTITTKRRINHEKEIALHSSDNIKVKHQIFFRQNLFKRFIYLQSNYIKLSIIYDFGSIFPLNLREYFRTHRLTDIRDQPKSS